MPVSRALGAVMNILGGIPGNVHLHTGRHVRSARVRFALITWRPSHGSLGLTCMAGGSRRGQYRPCLDATSRVCPPRCNAPRPRVGCGQKVQGTPGRPDFEDGLVGCLPDFAFTRWRGRSPRPAAHRITSRAPNAGWPHRWPAKEQTLDDPLSQRRQAWAARMKAPTKHPSGPAPILFNCRNKTSRICRQLGTNDVPGAPP